jgi:hypothetical protein
MENVCASRDEVAALAAMVAHRAAAFAHVGPSKRRVPPVCVAPSA